MELTSLLKQIKENDEEIKSLNLEFENDITDDLNRRLTRYLRIKNKLEPIDNTLDGSRKKMESEMSHE